MNYDRRQLRFWALWEAWYPALLSLILTAGLWWIGLNATTPNVDKIVDASINLASINIGLLGALLGILISVKDAKLIDFIFRSVHRDTVYRYIRQSIFSGFLTIGFGAASYIDMGTVSRSSPTWDVIFLLWLYFSLFLLISSYRIVDILMYLLSNKDISVDRPETDKMSPEEVEKLKRQTGRNQSEL